jgi:hypothetical protein
MLEVQSYKWNPCPAASYKKTTEHAEYTEEDAFFRVFRVFRGSQKTPARRFGPPLAH